jgi:hypothetical protein
MEGRMDKMKLNWIEKMVYAVIVVAMLYGTEFVLMIRMG